MSGKRRVPTSIRPEASKPRGQRWCLKTGNSGWGRGSRSAADGFPGAAVTRDPIDLAQNNRSRSAHSPGARGQRRGVSGLGSLQRLRAGVRGLFQPLAAPGAHCPSLPPPLGSSPSVSYKDVCHWVYPGYTPHLKTPNLISSAKTLFPHKVTLTGWGWVWTRLWGPPPRPGGVEESRQVGA